MSIKLNRFAACAILFIAPVTAVADWTFTDVSESAGAAWRFELVSEDEDGGMEMAGGVAAGDYDRDGDTDLYVMTGDISPNALLRNDGDGQFTNVSEAAGTGLDGHRGMGPAFADIDADGWPDLVVGGIVGDGYRVLKNNGDGTFSEITEQAGITKQSEVQNDFSSAFGDPDNDGDLDVFVSHWGAQNPVNHLWMNTGDGAFVPADADAGIDAFDVEDWSFSPIFTDTDGDGTQDLLVSSDFGTSQTFQNMGRAVFHNNTTEFIDDENGMGTTTADYDNDGDIDWFVTSIYDEDDSIKSWGQSGNRLYNNNGDGSFANITGQAGVADGFWGWGACSADFDNDGWVDIFHVNGFPGASAERDFRTDPSRLFINQQDGTFVESSATVGILDQGQGRGVVCFDYDRDGDIDLFVSNYDDETRLYRNELDENPGWLQVRLEGETNNPSANGAVIRVRTGDLKQMREVTIGSNYQSQNPLVQHFGLGGAAAVDELTVSWPHGGETVLTDVTPNQELVLSATAATPPPFTLESGHSSAWYDISHNGEGFLIEIHNNNVAVVYWFTYDKDGNQDWYIGPGEIVGRRILIRELYRVTGGEFGPGFDPDKIVETAVGTAAFTFTSCDSGFMDWSLNEASGTPGIGRQELERLTSLMGLDCGFAKGVPERPEGRYSGSWFDLTHAGEGFVVEVLFDSRVAIYWFSYDTAGNRRWFFGVGEIRDGKLVVDNMLTSTGGIFGDDFDPLLVDYPPWGSLELDITCAGGTATWTSTEEGFVAGTLNVQQISKLADVGCED